MQKSLAEYKLCNQLLGEKNANISYADILVDVNIAIESIRREGTYEPFSMWYMEILEIVGGNITGMAVRRKHTDERIIK